MKLVVYATALFLGFVVGSLDCGIGDWQSWAILICYVLPNALWMHIDRGHKRK